VRNEAREAQAVIRRETCPLGEVWGCARERNAARRTLYTLQLSLNHSETVGVSQVPNKVTSFMHFRLVCGTQLRHSQGP